MCATVWARENGEQIIGGAARVTIDAIELGSFPKALCRCEPSCRGLQAKGELNAEEAISHASHGQALAALRAAAGENLATRSSSHARTKPVSALTMQFARLIGALHDETRRESCAKTSTWWAEKKAGKGTQRIGGCQAGALPNILICDVARLWITRATSV